MYIVYDRTDPGHEHPSQDRCNCLDTMVSLTFLLSLPRRGSVPWMRKAEMKWSTGRWRQVGRQRSDSAEDYCQEQKVPVPHSLYRTDNGPVGP